MKTKLLLALIISASFLCFACDKHDVESPIETQDPIEIKQRQEGESINLNGVTLTIEEITTTSINFSGVINKMSPDVLVGIYWDYYPIEHISDTYQCYPNLYDNGIFSFSTLSLNTPRTLANTTIYCLPYVSRYGVVEYGNCFSVKTKEQIIRVESVEVGETLVRFTIYGYFDERGGGILCSKDKDLSRDNYVVDLHLYHRDLYDKTETFSITGLQRHTTYYYRTYYWDVELDNYVYGEVNSFCTY